MPPRGSDTGFDVEALDALTAVHRFAYHLTRDPVDAEDLVQETYARAYAAREQYRPGTNCTAWLMTICRNTFLQRRARAEREPAVSDSDLEALAAAAVHVSAQAQGFERDAFERPDFQAALTRGLAGLPEVFRAAVVLVDLEDFSYAEAAEVMQVPVGTLRSRLFRGRRLLQEALLDFAIDAGLVSTREGGAT
jgi:RNA polymerase sigma-70 factor (ECF subfamily)